MTIKKISFRDAEEIALSLGIRNPGIKMFDKKNIDMFGTIKVEYDDEKERLLVTNIDNIYGEEKVVIYDKEN